MANKKNPYRIYLPDEVIKALDDAAEKTGMGSGNQVAADVIAHCLPVWLAAKEAVAGALDDYLRQLVSKSKAEKT